MEIRISPFFAKFILRLNRSNRVLVMCRGYDNDDENFTELVWEDDKDLDFNDKVDYLEYHLWIR